MKKIGMFLLVLFLFSSCRGRQDRLNLLIITIDALRADHMSLYGYSRRTSPNLDEFSRRARVFENAFCTIPKTSASLASMLTGLHPSVLKIKPNLGTLRKGFLTLAEALKEKGYTTGASVFNGNLDRAFGFAQGFDFYDEVWKRDSRKELSADLITRTAVKFLRENADHSFFLWLHYIDPHAPYQPQEKWVEETSGGMDIREVNPRIVVGEGEWVDLEGHPHLGYYVARYDGEIRKADYYVGKVLEELKGLGLLNKTMVIISADHGEELGEHNLFFDHGPLPFNSSVRIPLILYLPGEKPGRIKDAVSLMDVVPTVAEVLNLQFPYSLTGSSLLHPQPGRRLLILGLMGHAVVDFPEKMNFISERGRQYLGLGSYYLYDVKEDPLEHHPLPLTSLKISRFTHLRDWFLGKYIKQSKKFRGHRGQGKISRKTMENLKSLGYVK